MNAGTSTEGGAAEGTRPAPSPVGALRPSRKRRLAYATVALGVALAALAVNMAAEPNFWTVSVLAGTVGAATPLVLAAIAETPAILVGNGGLDLSVGPLMSLINVLVVRAYMHGATSPAELIGIALALGVGSGALNGALVSFARIQPIVATFGTFMIYEGLATHIFPSPGGRTPLWLSDWAGTVGPVPSGLVVIGLVAGGWLLLRRSRFMSYLYAVGGDQRASYASGVPVSWVKFGAFVLTGLLTSVAALLLTAEIGSADGTIGTSYTLMAIAAVALGGTSLTGGRGGIGGAIAGSAGIFLIENAISVLHIAVFFEDLVYGAMLVVAVTANAALGRLSLRARA